MGSRERRSYLKKKKVNFVQTNRLDSKWNMVLNDSEIRGISNSTVPMWLKYLWAFVHVDLSPGTVFQIFAFSFHSSLRSKVTSPWSKLK